TPGKEKISAQVNVRGVHDLRVGWRAALAASANSKVVVFGSKSTTTTPGVPNSAVKAFLAGDMDKGVSHTTRISQAGPPFTYAASKIAV
ncbi:NAD-dependent epimerase, partial [Rhodococcus sp. PAE-6]|nr:NAD-dependent epimerase [Rhodococcus sp. PAE-6]